MGVETLGIILLQVIGTHSPAPKLEIQSVSLLFLTPSVCLYVYVCVCVKLSDPADYVKLTTLTLFECTV